jgi:fluoroquinolone transport system permease protein
MSRLAATTRLDMVVQVRSKLYAIAVGMAVLLGVAMRILIPTDMIPNLMPLFYLMAVGNTAYVFVAGMVIFEKDEGTLDAQIVTPLRVEEYLAAKAVSLLVVVLIESVTVLFIAYGFTGYNPLLLLSGLLFMSLGLTWTGFVQVSRYDSVTDFIVYAVPVVLVLQLPALGLLGIVPSPVWYLIPTMAPALLMTAAFTPLPAWQMVYALVYSVVSVIGVFWWAKHAFHRNIVLKGGAAV